MESLGAMQLVIVKGEQAMTRDELNEHIKELDATIGLGIHTHIVKSWLEDIRDNGIKEKADMNSGRKVRLGKYRGKPFYIKSVEENWECGKPSDIEIHGTTDEGLACISSGAAEVAARVFSKAKVVKDND